MRTIDLLLDPRVRGDDDDGVIVIMEAFILSCPAN
jgi:hypothetical protein